VRLPHSCVRSIEVLKPLFSESIAIAGLTVRAAVNGGSWAAGTTVTLIAALSCGPMVGDNGAPVEILRPHVQDAFLLSIVTLR